ncbi:O-antigen ligase family protein [Tsuneonella amylolytica]|uniref:O-antigen ligase family protein n=1 Tax=Tsuneonella amylolytica TaxID=2338327 RepID=UPI000EA8F73D|nr:O-antigen ligase family protein [Tsuneonella amylolytica]
MRFIGLFLLIAMVPVLVWWLKAYPHQRKWAYAAIGALPFVINAVNLDAAFIAWSTWPGYAKGLIFTALDSLALALIITFRGSFRRLPLQITVLFYLIATIVSLAFSGSAMSSAFYVFQVGRLFLVFVAVAAVVAKPHGIRFLCFGLGFGAIFQAVAAVNERFSGALQSSGTMGHQNLLGMMLHFVTLPLLALLLAGEKNKLVPVGLIAALVAVALGASRGAIGFVAMGIGLLFLLSLLRGANAHKRKVVGAAVVGLMIIGPLTYESLTRRLEVAPTASASGYDERAAFERAARAMWSDHPMGVGANQYVVTANTQGYSKNAGVAWSWRSRSANVHNVYLLVGAETGYLGLIALIAMFGSAIALGFRYVARHPKDPRGDVVLGFTVAILVMSVHSLYEWIFVTYQAQYMFAIALGVIAGFARQDRITGVRKVIPARFPEPRTLRSRESVEAARALGVD